MRISDWSSDVCSSDLVDPMNAVGVNDRPHVIAAAPAIDHCQLRHAPAHSFGSCTLGVERPVPCEEALRIDQRLGIRIETLPHQPTLELRTTDRCFLARTRQPLRECECDEGIESPPRSEEHTSELTSLIRITYADFSLKKKINNNVTTNHTRIHKQDK